MQDQNVQPVRDTGLNKFQEVARATAHRENPLIVRAEHVQFLVILGIIAVLRLTSLDFNTLFIDEAIYATVGKEAWSGIFTQAASAWMFGSYMYPLAAAAADSVGGVVLLRGLSAAFSLAAAIYVYLAANRLFGQQAALWSMLIFGLTGVSISLGQQAVYDAMALPFLAASFYYMVHGVLLHREGRSGRFQIFLSAAALILAALAKYISLIYAPTLMFIAALIFLARGYSIGKILRKTPWLYFVIPLVVVVAGYAVINLQDMMEVFSGEHSTEVVDRARILTDIWEGIGPVFVAAIVGALFIPASRFFRVKIRRPGVFGLFMIAVPLLLAALMILPVYHIVSSNLRGLSKHIVFALIFIAPLAGYAVAYFTERLTSLRRPFDMPVRIAGAAATTMLLFGFASTSIDQHWEFQSSWPDFSEVIEYLEIYQEIDEDSFILASGSAIYEYYFDLGPANRDVYFSTWYLKYETPFGLIVGEEAMRMAIQDCALDIIILDDYYTPDTNDFLRPILDNSAYSIAFETGQELRTGDVIGTRVYTPTNLDRCR